MHLCCRPTVCHYSHFISNHIYSIALCFSGLGYNLMNHPLSFGQTTDSDGKKHQVAFSKGPNRQYLPLFQSHSRFLFESFNVCIVLYLFVLGVVLHDWISTENSQKGKRYFLLSLPHSLEHSIPLSLCFCSLLVLLSFISSTN